MSKVIGDLEDFLSQGEMWIGAGGRYIDIDNMTVTHRRRAAIFLLRKAEPLALQSMIDTDPPASEAFRRISTPTEWVKELPLYRRLIQDGADPDEDPPPFRP